MSLYFFARGNCYLGENARFEVDDNGGCVAVGQLDVETNEVIDGTVSVYGDYQASKYLSKILELIRPDRKPDIPDFKNIVRNMYNDKNDICDYCDSDLDCNDCIIREWKNGGDSS